MMDKLAGFKGLYIVLSSPQLKGRNTPKWKRRVVESCRRMWSKCLHER